MTDTQTTARPPAADVDLEDVRDVAAYAEQIARVLSGVPLPRVGGYRTTIMQTLEQSAAAIRQLAIALEQVREENRRLREALEQYADRGNWLAPDWVGEGDGWELARRALHPEPEA
jgi:hypothetical protein